jgi:hypothetical protein
VAETLAKAGGAEEAIKVARSIEEPRERARALTKPDSTDDLIVSGDLARVGCQDGLEMD